MKHLITIAVLFIFLSCSSLKKGNKSTPITIKSEFNSKEVSWFKNSGNGSIKGTVKFKSMNGKIRFGKEFRIELMPKCKYTVERLRKIYKNKNSDFVYIENGIPKFTPDPKGYHDTKKTMCNEKGEFVFDNLSAGDYYVIAFMLWDKTGGGIMQAVMLNNEESKIIEMTNF